MYMLYQLLNIYISTDHNIHKYTISAPVGQVAGWKPLRSLFLAGSFFLQSTRPWEDYKLKVSKTINIQEWITGFPKFPPVLKPFDGIIIITERLPTKQIF